MKKILALVLAIIMMAALAVPAFAELAANEIDETSVTQGAELTVEYGVARSYVVSFPADVAFDNATLTNEQKLGATNVKLKGTEQLEITVASDNGYKMYDAAGKSVDVDYTVTIKGDINHDGTDDANKLLDDSDGLALVVIRPVGNQGINKATENEVDIVFATNGTSQEGHYVDTLTFTAAIGTYAGGATAGTAGATVNGN